MNDELFSHRVRRYRETHGYSQDDAGALLGVTGRYIGMIERGEKEVEPTSSIYKLFGLLENNKVHPSEFTAGHLAAPHREEPVHYRTGPAASSGSNGLTLPDVMAQVRTDMAAVESAPMPEKRRAFLFLREVHLPCLARLLKLE